MTSLTRRLTLCAALALAAAPSWAADTAEQAAIRQLLMHAFDKPEARLTVDPIVVQGAHAVAGWTQGVRGGRAVLRRDGKHWQITVCGGDGLKQAQALADTGMPAADAKALAQALATAEARLPASQRAKFATFEGLMRMDAHGHHPH
jgi:hypothetical protein